MTKTLFDRPLAHTNDPITSYEAGDKMVKSGALHSQEDYLYCAILRIYAPINREFTAKELSDTTGINYYTIQRRLSGLRDKGKIGRVRKDGGLCRGPKPLTKYLVVRDNCCVWKLKGE